MKPNFKKGELMGLGMFETHVQHLISFIPKDGRTVDLHE